jgi:zinc/manganese transport system permease protein
MSHAVLPGAAIGFLIGGLALGPMSLGGFLAGLAVALLSGAITRATSLSEDASFAAFYPISLATGVLLVSLHGSNVDLMHVLFGTVLAIDDGALLLVSTIASVTLLALAAAWRPLVVESFDPAFLRAVGGGGALYHYLFLVLVVINLVAGFQALGTLMAVGLMTLPAAAARFWTTETWSMSLAAVAIAFLAGVSGLLASFHLDLPSGPAIVLVAGAIYLFSVAFGRRDSLSARFLPRRHLAH